MGESQPNEAELSDGGSALHLPSAVNLTTFLTCGLLRSCSGAKGSRRKKKLSEEDGGSAASSRLHPLG